MLFIQHICFIRHTYQHELSKTLQTALIIKAMSQSSLTNETKCCFVHKKKDTLHVMIRKEYVLQYS